MKARRQHREEMNLGDAVDTLLNECRMILPGIQALFGFQLIAVFNQGFGEKLSTAEQQLHLLALALVALAGALVMTPAAYHRQTAIREASDGFIMFAGWLLLIAMIPLMLGIGMDFYLIARIILKDPGLSLFLSALLVLFFAAAWFLLPRLRVLRRMTGEE